MCIIAVKPAGITIDDTAKEWLRNGGEKNQDGAGLMYSDGSVVHYNKGWEYEDKSKRFIERAASIPAKYPMVIHFRNASPGTPRKPGNTHPIPLFDGSDGPHRDHVPNCDDILLRTKGTCYIALVHNGNVTELLKENTLSDTYSDTQMLAKELKNRGIEAEKVPDELLRKYTVRTKNKDNRYAVMTPTALHVIGDFIAEKNGWLFSNGDYRSKHEG